MCVCGIGFGRGNWDFFTGGFSLTSLEICHKMQHIKIICIILIKPCCFSV